MNFQLLLGCMMPVWVISLSYGIAYCALAVAVAVAVASFVMEVRRRNLRWLPLYAGFLALMPGWHLLSWEEVHDGILYPRGDCGYGNRSASLFLLGAILAVFVIVWRRLPLSRRAFVFRLAAAFTLLSITDEVYKFSPLNAVIPTGVVFWEIYNSIFFPGGRLITLILILICVLLYLLQRLRIPKAV